MNQLLEKCELCPRKCKINRNKGEIGFCRAGQKLKIALINLHKYEEPCISGKKGSGTVFFSGCNLNCVYCQNYEISQKTTGREYSVEELVNLSKNYKYHNFLLSFLTSFIIPPPKHSSPL